MDLYINLLLVDPMQSEEPIKDFKRRSYIDPELMARKKREQEFYQRQLPKQINQKKGAKGPLIDMKQIQSNGEHQRRQNRSVEYAADSKISSFQPIQISRDKKKGMSSLADVNYEQSRYKSVSNRGKLLLNRVEQIKDQILYKPPGLNIQQEAQRIRQKLNTFQLYDSLIFNNGTQQHPIYKEQQKHPNKLKKVIKGKSPLNQIQNQMDSLDHYVIDNYMLERDLERDAKFVKKQHIYQARADLINNRIDRLLNFYQN